jgi:hypothetical protein
MLTGRRAAPCSFAATAAARAALEADARVSPGQGKPPVFAFHSLYTKIKQSRKQTDALTHASVRQDKL